MNIAAVLPHAANSGDSDSTNSAQDTNNLFLNLLTVQLKNQSPLDPVDPNQFATQLVQFNMLDQLIQINQTLKGDVPTGTNTGSGNK
jgi:flagellar basal-body rod modification protein FlgD